MGSIKKRLKDKIVNDLDLSRELLDEDIIAIIDRCIIEESETEYLSLKEKVQLRVELFNSLRKLDVLTELLEQDQISEIMVNGYKDIFVEEYGGIKKLDLAFESEEKLQSVIQQIVAGCNRRINESSPIVDARLSDGSRVNIVLNPVSISGPAVTIRKFPKHIIDMEELIALGAIDRETAEFLEKLVRSKYNIFISGGTGSGKTTFLNALSEYIPKHERVITIEDSAELQLRNLPNLVTLEAKNANVEGENSISIRDLIKTSLRMRPSRIIVGEVRDSAAIDMLSAMNTGHDGSLSTGHANSASDMISRLETMVLMGMDIPLLAIKSQIVSAVDIIIHLGRLRDGSRKVLSISEVMRVEKERVILNTLYEFCEESNNEKAVFGKLKKINDLANINKMLSAGYSKNREDAYGLSCI